MHTCMISFLLYMLFLFAQTFFKKSKFSCILVDSPSVFSFLFPFSLTYLERLSRYTEKMEVCFIILICVENHFELPICDYLKHFACLLNRSCWIWWPSNLNPSFFPWDKEASIDGSRSICLLAWSSYFLENTRVENCWLPFIETAGFY